MIFDAVLYSEEWVASHIAQGCFLSGGGLSERNSVFEVDSVKYVLYTLENNSELQMMIEAGKIGIAPQVLASFPNSRQVLMEYISDPTITPQVASLHAKAIGATLKKAHSLPLLEEAGEGFEKQNLVRWKYIQSQAARYNTEVSRSLLEMAAKAMEIFEQGMRELGPPTYMTNIHIDLHPRNLFWTEDRGLLMIDWESASHGHPYFDLASLAIFLLPESAEEELLEGYFGRMPNREELAEGSKTAILNHFLTSHLLRNNNLIEFVAGEIFEFETRLA